MTEAVFVKIQDQLTVFGEHTRVSAQAANLNVLAALSSADRADVEEYIANRVASENRASFDLADSALSENVRGDVYLVTSKAKAGIVEVVVQATLRMPRRGANSVVILAWA